MPIKKRTLQERMLQWETTRSRSRKSYIIKTWIIPYAITLPLTMCLVSVAFLRVIGIRLDIQIIGYFFVIFGPIIVLITILFGVYSWNYWEREWVRWKTEDKRGIIKLSGNREVFQKYPLFLLAFYVFPFFFLLILSLFVIILLWFSLSSLIICLVLLVSCGIFSMATMILLRNPICGHGLIFNPEKLELYPNVKESPLKFAWGILKGKPFMCMVCGERYILEKKGDQVEIVKLEKDA